ncbi:Uu.00g016260.m01.CDS01 [Anthostomella pinea]|uniref:Uu.00g016260.m01.CDS01 n=1 Tax=Anthostomella pinea TaxID=933095 RepID=A0AAI8VYP6_9PEZI|nr:Uu.00g016260.m01.CDS01 [Anthostomella pinea]
MPGKIDPRGKGGKGLGGKGLGGKGGTKRHRKILRDNIQGISQFLPRKPLLHDAPAHAQFTAKPAIRRLARREGVKRISGQIYEAVREAMKERMTRVRTCTMARPHACEVEVEAEVESRSLTYRQIIRDVVTFTEYRQRKTVTVGDVLHALRRIGRPIYGFDDIKTVQKAPAAKT